MGEWVGLTCHVAASLQSSAWWPVVADIPTGWARSADAHVTPPKAALQGCGTQMGA